MPIGYGRWDFVKRSSGQNMVVKAAYNSRSRIEFYGNVAAGSRVYDYSYREDPVFHSVLLPKGADVTFLNSQTLWNTCETKEVKVNSQPGFEGVLALPDDVQISVENRIEMAKEFLNEQFVKRGLAVQLDVHQPDKIFTFTKDSPELDVKSGEGGKFLREEKGEYVIGIQKGNSIDRTVRFDPKTFKHFQYREHNWHAHFLVTSRRFTADGKDLGKKARDMMPQLRTLKSVNKAAVVEKSGFGKQWEEYQNDYFLRKGIDLQVDPSGIIPQKHLGPVRMRARAFDLLEEYESRLSDNKLLCGNVDDVLEKITEQRSIFDQKHVDSFIEKHVEFPSEQKKIKEMFWQQKELVSLLDPKTQKPTGKFSTQTIVKDEQALSRVADKIHEQEGFYVKEKIALKASTKEGLKPEQQKAFKAILAGKKLSCLQGFAGTGKGRVLSALREAYTNAGYKVRGFGPDNATAEVLKGHKFGEAENIYKFTHAAYRGYRKIKRGGEVWICDETSKLGNRPFAEFLKLASKEKAQVIFCGDTKQISSIDRGGMFAYLQDKYGAQTLQDIQRQRKEEQRYVSKALAIGNVGAAFNALESMQSFKWNNTKKEAVQALFEEWAKDSLSRPQSSSLMVAHSNAIVNTLNELARTARKERGELSTQEEFCCETKFGNIYVSPGDKIQFRKKDFDLGIENGLIGWVTKAKENQFTVLVDQGGKFKRKIVFNPQKYNAFQLGYATTYVRSQGETVDRCYVLDSPHLNKESFYVALTRHVNKVKYFVYKDSVKSLADLKAKAAKDETKRCTLHYTTGQSIELERIKQQRNTEINDLKQSDELLSKVKGHFLGIKDTVAAGFGKKMQEMSDIRADKDFYNPNLPDEEKRKAGVQKIVGVWDADASTQIHHFLKKEEILSDVDRVKNEQKKFETFLKKQQWGEIGEGSRAAFKGYFKLSKEASNLYQAIKAESEFSGIELKNCLSFSGWQQVCAKRNEVAYQIVKEVGKESSTKVLGEKSYKIVETLAVRHEAVLEKDNKRQKAYQDLKCGLEQNVEALLYKLFPEGPKSKTGAQMRFGSKGSLCVNVAGSKSGLFYDHENQEGGNLLKLIQKTQGLNSKEAKEWAGGFLNIASEIRVPSVFEKSTNNNQKDSSWISLKPPAEIKVPSLKEVNPGLSHYYKEEARHSYRDEQGQLLYQVLRLRSKEDSSTKMTPPLSYGYSGDSNQPCWKIKGFKPGGKKPLYNLYELTKNPKKNVLIVEGEKTADKAAEKFSDKDLVCVTWSGGAGAVSQADWSPLAGRNVIIWPDNDHAGFKAAEDISVQMGLVGAKEVRVVDDKDLFKHLPQKWDLADEIPVILKPEDLERAFSHGTKQLMVEDVISGSKLSEKPASEKLRVRDLFVHYHQKHSDALFQRLHSLGSYAEKEEALWAYKSEIQYFVESFSEVKKEISSNSLVNAKGEIADRLSYQILLFSAKEGRAPSIREVNLMKGVISQIQKSHELTLEKGYSDEIFSFAKDRVFEKACVKAVCGKSSDIQSEKHLKSEISQECASIQVQERQMAQNLQVKQVERNHGLDLSSRP